MSKPERLSPQQAAELCGVSRSTLLRWLHEGQIPHTITGGGWRRIGVRDLVSFMRAHGIPVPLDIDPGPPRILLVDDEPSVTRGLRRILRRRLPAAEVHEVHDGFSAGLAALELLPHVMVLDLRMPGADGVEVCVRMRQQPRLRGTAVVVLSGHLDDTMESELKALGVHACLRKPANPDLLMEAIAPCIPEDPPGV